MEEIGVIVATELFVVGQVEEWGACLIKVRDECIYYFLFAVTEGVHA